MSISARAAMLLAVTACMLAGLPAGGLADRHDYRPLRHRLERLIDRGGVAVAERGRTIFRYGEGQYQPASILKIATALTALEILGSAYRFKTEVHLDNARNLIVKGFGDPFLISEEWALMATALKERGVFAEPLGSLVLDESAFPAMAVDGAGKTSNPYDAELGALVSNFNTVNIRVTPQRRVYSAEPQTPITALARELGRGLPPGTHRVNLSRRPGNARRYTGELVQAIFTRAGAEFTGGVRSGRVAPGSRRVLDHRSSRELTMVLQGMLKFSNNVIANQVVLTMDLERHGPPARLSRGVALIESTLRSRLNLEPGALVLAEGSGISRQNRVTLAAMLAVVQQFSPWRHLLSEFTAGGAHARAKTGNLTGVYTLAGFLPAAGGDPRPFVILLNQARNTRREVFRQIYKVFGPPQ